MSMTVLGLSFGFWTIIGERVASQKNEKESPKLEFAAAFVFSVFFGVINKPEL